MSSSSNKRKFPRVEGKGIAAYLRLNGHNAGCTVQNISVGGIFVRTDRFLPVGTKLAFDLVKPGMKKALSVSGWVVGVITPELSARTKLPQGLRIQFAKMVPSASEALQELVGSLRRPLPAGAEPPVLYPVESKPAPSSRRASGSKRAPRPTAPPLRPPPARAPSRALGDEPPNSTEVDMDARGDEDPSVVRKWFEGGEEDEEELANRSSDDRPMIDDSLLDSAGEADLPDDSAADEELDQEPAADEDEEDAGEEPAEEPASDFGPNPFEDEDQTIGADPTRVKAAYGGESPAAKRPTAPRPPPSRVRPAMEEAEEEAPDDETPGGSADVDELVSTNRELQRLLERREGEIAALRAQVTKLEQSLKDREEQLQLAKRVLKTNGLG